MGKRSFIPQIAFEFDVGVVGCTLPLGLKTIWSVSKSIANHKNVVGAQVINPLL
jgi:hypothetical protein